MQAHVLKVFLAGLSLLGLFCSIDGISCKDESGVDIDWFINYKFPKLKNTENRLVRKGEAYAYLTPEWMDSLKLSKLSFVSRRSMLGKTLSQYYRAPDIKNLTYLFYNGEMNSKGVILFDEDSGIWLIHSIPRFPDPKSHWYPKTEYEHAHMVLCMTFRTRLLNEIGNQLVYIEPYTYASNLNKATEENLDRDARSLFTNYPEKVRRTPFTRNVKLGTKGSVNVTSFVKVHGLYQDIYTDILAPKLKTDLYVKSYRDKSDEPLEASCDTKYTVQDVSAIKDSFGNGTRQLKIAFLSTEDGSKWAISTSEQSPWFCVGDLDRTKAIFYRSGGAVCTKSLEVWKAFSRVIDDYDTC